MLKTSIEWCDSTVNPVMGCDGCEIWNALRRSCFAGVLHRRYGGLKGFAPTFEEPTLFPGRMNKIADSKDLTGTSRPDKPWLDGKPRLIFVNDMGDALSKSVPFAFLQAEIFDVACSPQGRRHRWLWLTKKPFQLLLFSKGIAAIGLPWPTNLWVGTSMTKRHSADRLLDLLKVGDESTRFFLSVEPQLESIAIPKPFLECVHWVIQGGESGDDPRPFHLEWAELLREQCQNAGVPYFLKQIGANPMLGDQSYPHRSKSDEHGRDWSIWPAGLRVREVP